MKRAEELMESLEKEFPQHPLRMIHLAGERLRERRPEEALRLLAAAQPRTDAVRAACVKIAWQERRPLDAALWLTEPAGPALLDVMGEMVPLLAQEERWKELAALPAQLRESLTNQAAVLLHIGRALTKTGRPAEALPVLLRVLPEFDSAVPPTTVHYLQPRGLSLVDGALREARELTREQRIRLRGEEPVPPAVQCLGAICRAAGDAKLDDAARHRLARHLNGLMRDAGLVLFLPEHGVPDEDLNRVAAQLTQWWSEFEGSEALAVWFLQNEQVTAIPRPALELLWKHQRGDRWRIIRTACGLALHPETKDPLTYLEKALPDKGNELSEPDGFWPGLESKLAGGWEVPQPLADRMAVYAGLGSKRARSACMLRLASPEALAAWMKDRFAGKHGWSSDLKPDGRLSQHFEWMRQPEGAWARKRIALALPHLASDEQRDHVRKTFGIAK
jgi:hypothetical protein